MAQEKQYYAFISYKSEDVEWASWVQHELEHYHLPASFNGRNDIDKELRPVFRDINELSAGNLPEQIKKALQNSKNLIVVCSPQSAKSEWVNKEIEEFISLGKTNRIFPFIVEGNSPAEYFPPALKNLSKQEERLGGDVSTNGRDMAFVKVVAGILGVDFDSLWQRYEREKAEEEMRKKEERDNLLRLQSRYIAEKCNKLVEDGDGYLARLYAMAALPKNLDNPNRPYTAEAEAALRKSCSCQSGVLHDSYSAKFFDICPDGTEFLSVGANNAIKIWDIETGALLDTFGRKFDESTVDPSVTGFSFEPFDDKLYRFYDSKGKVREIDKYNINEYVSAQYSHDGTMIISLIQPSVYDDETIMVWNAKNKKLLKILSVNYMGELEWETCGEYKNTYPFPSISPDGTKELLLYKDSESIEIRDIESRELIRTLEGAINFAVYSPDGNRIVAGYYTQFKIWDAHSGELLDTIKDHKGIVNFANFTPNGTKFISCSEDHTIRIKERGNAPQTFSGHTEDVKECSFNHDRLNIVSRSNNAVKIWDAKSGELLKTFEGENRGASFTPDNNVIILYNYSFKIYDVERGLLLKEINSEDCGYTFPCAPASPVLYNDTTKIAWNSKTESKTIKIFDIWSGELLKTINLGKYWPFLDFLVFNKDASKIAFAKNPDRIFRVWDVENEVLSQTFKGHTGCINSFNFSPDGTMIVSAANDHTVKLWNIKTGECIHTIIAHSGSVYHASFSHDGTKIISCDGFEAKVWDVASGKLIYTFYDRYKTYYNYATFSPDDSKILLATEHNIELWDFKPLQELIDETRERFRNRSLTPEERQVFYLE